MNQQEKALYKSLCSFKKDTFDSSLLVAATPNVLGQLFFNRMSAVAYGTLNKHSLLGKVNREFRNCLENAHTQNCRKNESFFWCVQYVEELLSFCQCKYAMLKGAYLCKRYPDGYRTSNDIDLLVHPEEISEISRALFSAGFKQGNIRSGKFIPATRFEIIESKMTRGETVPYIKEVNLPWMQFLEVDINFSLDYKPGDKDVLTQMLNNAKVEEVNGDRIPTLRSDDFFVHLCCHLYKEATALPWVEMMRDMTMYKYCDIYMLINGRPQEEVDRLFARAKELGMEKICAFAVLQMSKLFDCDNMYAIRLAEITLENEPMFIHTVVAPKEKKLYRFSELNIEERFFADNRKNLLQEVEAE